MSRQSRLIWGFLGGMFSLFLAASWASTVYIDYFWFDNLQYAPVFWRTVLGRWSAGLVGGALFAAIIFFNLRFAVRDGFHLPLNVVPFPYNRWLRPRRVLLVILAMSGFFGVTAGLSTAAEWLSLAAYFKQVPFGVADPLFGKDVAFFVFSLPVWSLAQQLLSGAAVLSLLLAGAVYALTGKVALAERWPMIHPRARGHVFALLAAFLFLKAGGYIIDMYRLVYSPRGVAFGASYTDVHAQLPALKALAALAAIVGLLALANIFTRGVRWVAGGAVVLVAASLLLGSVLPAMVQKFVVEPNEIVKESPYIKHNVAYTRMAYNLNRIAEKEFPAAASLTAADLATQQGTLENIRLWDWAVLRDSFQQLQAIRQYYNFDEVDVDRYNLDGRMRQVLLSAREIAYRNLPEDTWINRHLKYTHGYGIVATPAAEITSEGLPLLWIKDIPPASRPGLEVTRPQIYFGEQTDQYAIVRTAEAEFDYPQGDKNQYTRYQGRSGIPIGGPLERLAFAIYSGDYNVLFSRAIGRESQVLLHRLVRERIARIAPFLLLDPDPYLVVSRGKLHWIQDAYTVTGRYPYSEPMDFGNGRFNYIRNSVKVVVDAYDGDVRFYVADAGDPLIGVYRQVFPGLFRPLSEMDSDLRAHIRYPEFLFTVQLEQYAVYHMQDPTVFYNKEDRWTRPLQGEGAGARPREPYYVIMQLPDGKQPEFLLISPFTPNKKKNMVAWLAARSDGDHYGDLIVYKFPKQKLVYGPEQVEALITQKDEVVAKTNLWSQQKTEVKWGNLQAIPIRDALLYVQPLYLRSTSTGLPELRRVIVVYNNRVVMEENLERALNAIFGPVTPSAEGMAAAGPGGPPVTEPAAGQTESPAAGTTNTVPARDTRGLIREANRLYEEAQAAMKRGDWAAYGDRISRLGEALRRLSGSQP